MCPTLRNTCVPLFAALLAFCACTPRGRNEPPNTLHIPTRAKIKGLDPQLADDLYASVEVSRAYEPLLQYHYLKRPFTLVPNLAESMPEISADGLTYTFRLKKGVVFQDDACFRGTAGKGREMTAEDVVYTFKRLADPHLISPGWWIVDDLVVGLNEWHDAQAKAAAADFSAPVAGLKATDRYTFQLQLKHPSAQILYKLAMAFTAVVPHEAVEFYGSQFSNHPVGTGPYRLLEFNPSARLIWGRNPTYRHETYPSEGAPGDKEAGLLDDAGKTLPLSDRIVVTIFEETQPMWLNFMAGKLDFSELPKDNYGSAITPKGELTDEVKSKSIRMSKTPELEVTHDSFNMADPLIGKNKLLRQALSLAHDQASFNEIFYNGQAVAAQSPIPPGLGLYDPAFKNPYRQFNLARAKELLAKAGYPGGKGLPPIEYLAMADTISRQQSEFDGKAFGALGVKLNVSSFTWPEFQDALKNKKGQMWGFAWGADYPDEENFLQLFYSKNASPGPNDANYSNPAYDKMYERLLALQNGPERTELVHKMIATVVEDAPWIPGAHRIRFHLLHPWLRNFKFNEFDPGHDKYYRVDPALKK
jgi:ABC-type transport system substrate-binding protein